MRGLRVGFSAFVVASWLLVAAGCGRTPVERPLSSEEALHTFQLDPAFEIDVFAAEPFVRDPIDLAFDERGRVFVAEMLDYPYDDGSAYSRIRVLHDRSGDGVVDDAVVFADSLRQVTGLMPWGGGLIVTAAPDVLFLRDTTGDERADERRVLFTGFSMTNPQHRVANPRFGLDNWIYVANDGQPGTIRPVDRPGGGRGPGARATGSTPGVSAEGAGAAGFPSGVSDEHTPPISVHGADFRFRLDRAGDVVFEAAGGPAQYGQAFDAFGRRFVTHNTIHVRHVVLHRRYFERNPYMPARSTATDVSDHGLRVFQVSAPQAWRIARTDVRSRRYDALDLDRREELAGFFTAASGGTIYDGGVFPEPYRGNLFTGEVATNLIHRDVLEPQGATFVARRAPGEEEGEFLTSTDPWFRPSLLTVGPDGYLYVVDMYREIIESPEYIPEHVRERLDFYRGTEYGRIYRIRPRGSDVTLIPSPGDRVEELAEALDHPNAWWRLTAQRVLIERRDRAAVPLVREVARYATTPQGRLHALYVLESMEELDADLVELAMQDPEPGVREHAVRLAENFPELARGVVAAAEDPDARVRLQAALSLGTLAEEPATRRDAVEALALLASRYGDDPWFVTAVVSAPPGVSVDLVERVLAHRDDSETTAGIVQALASVVGAVSRPAEVDRTIELLAAASEREAGLSGLAAGFELAGARNLDVPRAAERLAPLLDESGAARRVAGFLVMPDRGSVVDSPEPPPAGPARVVALASRQSWIESLLSAIGDGVVSPAMLDADVRIRLLENPDEAVRRRAREVLDAEPVPVDASEVLARRGYAVRGLEIFNRECAVCHAGGRSLGPDLSGVSNRGREQLLEAIVDPSSGISPTYAAYVAELEDGVLVAGRIVSEMPGTRTFRGLRGDRTVLLSRIREMRSAPRSMMPEDYGARLGTQDLADLIAYLQATDVIE